MIWTMEGKRIVGDSLRRFWSYVEKTPTCWVWRGKINHWGYGLFSFNGKWRLAHRYSWSLHNGQEIPKGLVVLHHCDEPPCVNPEHLSVGTTADNNRDTYRKGRQVHQLLTPVEVNEIKAILDKGVRPGVLARFLGLRYKVVNRIKNGETWHWLERDNNLPLTSNKK